MTKRIIPCLDVKDGRTVKGINFVSLRDAGDPIELAQAYAKQGADELVFLDISATNESRSTVVDMVERVGEQINIPFTVGGGIDSLEAAAAVLRAGADKVAVNSAAIRRPELISELSAKFGEQCIVAAVDATCEDGTWVVYSSGGSKRTDKELFSWSKALQDLGAGEILFTSMDNDGTKEGFANEALARLSDELRIPVIASGGAGTMEDFRNALMDGKADAVLAASVFHFGEISVPELKAYLNEQEIPVRL